MTDHQQLMNEANKVLQAEYDRMMRVEPQLRRFARALADLGAPVPADWATQHDDKVEFAPLTPKAFDRLLCLLEDLAANRPITVTVHRGGPTLFHPGPPPNPTPPPARPSIHMVVPR